MNNYVMSALISEGIRIDQQCQQLAEALFALPKHYQDSRAMIDSLTDANDFQIPKVNGDYGFKAACLKG